MHMYMRASVEYIYLPENGNIGRNQGGQLGGEK